MVCLTPISSQIISIALPATSSPNFLYQIHTNKWNLKTDKRSIKTNYAWNTWSADAHAQAHSLTEFICCWKPAPEHGACPGVWMLLSWHFIGENWFSHCLQLSTAISFLGRDGSHFHFPFLVLDAFCLGTMQILGMLPVSGFICMPALLCLEDSFLQSPIISGS